MIFWVESKKESERIEQLKVDLTDKFCLNDRNGDNQIYKCEPCGYETDCEFYLNRHLNGSIHKKMINTQKYTYNCDCKTFKSNSFQHFNNHKKTKKHQKHLKLVQKRG